MKITNAYQHLPHPWYILMTDTHNYNTAFTKMSSKSCRIPLMFKFKILAVHTCLSIPTLLILQNLDLQKSSPKVLTLEDRYFSHHLICWNLIHGVYDWWLLHLQNKSKRSSHKFHCRQNDKHTIFFHMIKMPGHM